MTKSLLIAVAAMATAGPLQFAGAQELMKGSATR
jgi:hypothetical protein